MRWFPIRIRINLKRALFSIRNRWIPSPAENNDRAQISSGCWNDGCTKGSKSGCVQGFGARLTKKIGKCVLKCVLAKEKAVDSNESTAFILVEVTGLEPAASWSQTTRATNCATPRYSRAIARLVYYSTKRGGTSSPLRKLSMRLSTAWHRRECGRPP